MRPPICEVCDTRFSPREGALLSFRLVVGALEATTTDEQAGHPENQGWFCPEHTEDAEALTAFTLREAVQELASPMAAPGARIRRVFDELAETRSVVIESRSPEGIRTALVEAHMALTPLFDEPPNHLGSSSNRRPLPDSPVYPDAVDYRVSVAVSRGGTDATHNIAQTWYDSENRAIASRREMIVTVGGKIRFVFTFVPETGNPLECRRLVIREDPVFVQEDPVFAGASEVRGAVESFLSQFAVTEFDPFALEPDLVGVDLKGGRLAGSIMFESRSIEWDIAPTPVSQLEAFFVDNIDRLAGALDPGASAQDADFAESSTSFGSLERTTNRTWNPMDGATAPDCPFSDMHTSTGSVEASMGPIAVTLQRDQTHWNEDDVANSSVSLMLQIPGSDDPFYLAAHASGGLDAATLTLSRPSSPEVIAVVAALAKSLASD